MSAFSWGVVIKPTDIEIIKEVMDIERVEHVIFKYNGRTEKREIGHNRRTKKDTFIFKKHIITFEGKKILSIETLGGRK